MAATKQAPPEMRVDDGGLAQMETWFGNSLLAAGVTAAIAGLPAELSGTCIGLAMVAYVLRPAATGRRVAPKDTLRGSRA